MTAGTDERTPTPPTWLADPPMELRFGTSGLRGRVVEMTDLEIYINTRGFLAYLEACGEAQTGDTVAIAEDLRRVDPKSGIESSPRIGRAVARAVRDAGFGVVHCGTIPTPALAYHASGAGSGGGRSAMPGIMVTGSHIPADRNGVKFYKKRGEVLKSDEEGIARAVRRVRAEQYGKSAADSPFDSRGMLVDRPRPEPVDDRAWQSYVERYTALFAGRRPLAGQRVVVYQHSAVGRDLLPAVLEALGAEPICVDRTDHFVPVDTEDVTDDDEARFRRYATEYRPAAIVSTDGDSDRPLVVDEQGRFHRGDVLGIVTAELVGARFAAVPISTSDALDRHVAARGAARGAPPLHVGKTRIGSPYVIAAMTEEAERGTPAVVGWEANGGFLTATEVPLGDGHLAPLPTRDAMLPILAPLLRAVERGVPVSQLFAELPARRTRAGLLDDFPPERSRAILRRLVPEDPAVVDIHLGDGVVRVRREHDDAPRSASPRTAEELRAGAERLSRYFSADRGFGPVERINLLDGVRVWFGNGDIAHLRPSGNAPQLRIYAVSDSQRRADEIVSTAIAEPDGLLRQMERELGGGR